MESKCAEKERKETRVSKNREGDWKAKICFEKLPPGW
jgi:hypothetical protein